MLEIDTYFFVKVWRNYIKNAHFVILAVYFAGIYTLYYDGNLFNPTNLIGLLPAPIGFMFFDFSICFFTAPLSANEVIHKKQAKPRSKSFNRLLLLFRNIIDYDKHLTLHEDLNLWFKNLTLEEKQKLQTKWSKK